MHINVNNNYFKRQLKILGLVSLSLLLLVMAVFYFSLQQIKIIDGNIESHQNNLQLLYLIENKMVAQTVSNSVEDSKIIATIDKNIQDKVKHLTSREINTTENSSPNQNNKDAFDIRNILNTKLTYEKVMFLQSEEKSKLQNQVHKNEQLMSKMILNILLSVVLFGSGLIYLFWRSQEGLYLNTKNLVGKIKSISAGEEPVQLKTHHRDPDIYAISKALDKMASTLKDRQLEFEIDTHLVAEKKRLGDLTNVSLGMADEVGNPLTAMGGAVELLEQCWQNKQENNDVPTYCTDPDMVKNCFNVLKEQIERMTWLLRQVRSFNIFEKSHRELTDVNEVIHTSLMLLQLDKRNRNVVIEKTLDKNIPAVDLDRSSFSLGLLYLFGKAVGVAQKTNTTLQVKTNRSHNSVAITIQCPSVSKNVCESGQCNIPFCPSAGLIGKPEFEFSSVQAMVDEHGGNFNVFCGVDRVCGIRLEMPVFDASEVA